MNDALIDMLIRHEGLRLKMYLDTKGVATIGVGRNLEQKGVTEEEALQLLKNDIVYIEQAVRTTFSWYSGLSQDRQNVVLSMAFNIGLEGFSQFKGLIAAITAQDWNRAANEMMNSRWAAQVGKRAVELAGLMRGPIEGATVLQFKARPS